MVRIDEVNVVIRMYDKKENMLVVNIVKNIVINQNNTQY